MAFNIQNFTSNVNRYGVLQTNRYEVVFSPPAGLASSFGRDTSELLTYRADSVKMPGVNFANYETRRYGVGNVVKSPTNVQFSDIDISFIEAENQEVFDLFYKWSNLIVNYGDPIAGVPVSEVPGLLRQLYATNYKDTIVSKIVEIKIFNNRGTNKSVGNTPPPVIPTGIIELIDAFPISVTDNALSWSNNNNLFKVNVQFAFNHWRFKRA
jgi:hypothetical protein